MKNSIKAVIIKKLCGCIAQIIIFHNSYCYLDFDVCTLEIKGVANITVNKEKVNDK